MSDFSESIFGVNVLKSGEGTNGKSELASAGSAPLNPCPICNSSKIVCAGLRTLKDGCTVQRYYCKICGVRFSGKMLNADVSKLAVTEYASLRAINLCVPVRKRVGAGELTAETRASITVFAGWLEKEGYLESRYPNNLKTLVYLGADLKDPEDVKSKLGAHKIKNGAKLQYVYAYDAYCKMNGWTWNRPRYTQEETIPFIPDEGELDQLIAAARSKRMAAYLQTLKETFADPGEALRIEWIDISGNIITINHPVKGHRPRALEVSNKLLAMLNSLPHITERIFPCRYASLIDAYVDLRRRVAETTKNERLLAVEFRTFRHWGGTMIAQMTNGNVLIVMKLLGHKRVENSMKYINVYLLNFKQTEFEVASATTVEDAKPLIAAGFEFVLEKSGIMLFKRAKRFSPVANPISKRETDLVNLK